MAILNSPLQTKRMRITPTVMQRMRSIAVPERGCPRPTTYADVFRPAVNINAAEQKKMGLDYSMPAPATANSRFLGMIDPNVLPFATKFIGYPALSMLRQNIIIQNAIATFAQEMTKKWIEVKAKDDGDPKARILKLSPRIAGGMDEPEETPDDAKRVQSYGEKWDAEDLFRNIMMEVGFSGGCLVYVDNGDVHPENPIVLNDKSITKGSLRGFRIIEPMNCYALNYNATNPLAADYFRPTHWMILNHKVHASRLLYFAQNELPFLLRPAYNFFGIPVPQMMLDYLYNFERSRDAAARLIRNYSKRIISTDMSAVLLSGLCEDGEADDAMDVESIFNRVRIMQMTEDNDGYLLLDKDREQFDQLTTSLSGMMEMVSQQMELLALVLKIPVTKLFGTPPRGFNATGDAEKDDFANFIAGMRKQIIHKNVIRFYEIIQLNECGYITNDLDYKWPDLRETTDEQKATIRNQDANTGATLVGAGIVDAIEERQRLAATPGSGYEFIDAEDYEDPNVTDPFAEGEGEEETETDPPGGEGSGESRPDGSVQESASEADSADAGRRAQHSAIPRRAGGGRRGIDIGRRTLSQRAKGSA